MAGEIQIDSVTALTASGSNIVLNNVNTATNRTNLGLGSIATQAADSVSISGGNITGGTIGSGVAFPAGHVIQIQSSTLTAPETTSSTTSFETIDGTDQNGGGTEWCVKITPLLSSSKIYVSVSCGVVGGSSNVQRVYFGLFRDTTQIALGDDGTGNEVFMAWTPRSGDGYQMTNMSNSFLDSPTIPSTPVEIKYGLQWYAPSHTGTINRPSTVDANAGNAISTISVFEVAG